MLTIGWWFAVAITALLCGTAVYVIFTENWYMYQGKCILSLIVAIVLVVGVFFGGYWYCNSTAAGARALKDQQSNLGNGLMREIIVTAEDGREIFYYKGKCDIETNNSDYILFEDEDGYRHIIYKGALDTILVTELPKN